MFRFDPAIIDRINYAVRHAGHARQYQDMYSTLLQELIAKDPDGEWTSVRGGPNSNVLKMDNGVEWHLKGHVNQTYLELRHRMMGPVVLYLRTRVDIIRFVATL